MSRSLALLPAFSLLLSAQGAKPKAKPAPKKTPAMKEAKEEGAVVARIGAAVLTQSDLDAFLETLNPQQRMQLQFTPGGMDMVTKRLAERKLLAEKARRLGLEKDGKFLRRLAATKDELLAVAFLEKENESLQKKGEVGEDEVKAFYEAHKDKFSTPASYDARHILIKTRPEGAEKDRTDEEMQARVKEVQTALAAGKPFEDLVEQFTEDTASKPNKGLYTGVHKGQFVPEFEAASLKQEIGKLGEPVKTQYGIHLIRVEKRTEAQPQAFDAVKDQVKQQAQQEKGLKIWNELVEGLKKEIPFEILPPRAPKAAPAAAPAGKPALAPAPAAQPAEPKAEGDSK